MSASRVKWVVIAALIAGLIGVRPVFASAGAEPGASSPEAGKNEAPKDKKAEAPKTDGPPAGGGGPPPAKVRVDAVRLEPVERWREVTGELRAVRQTTVAAEQTGRRCIAVELDPKYCDVIVARWEKFAGKKAERRSA